jgi:lysyl-tRNA synthetase class 2
MLRVLLRNDSRGSPPMEVESKAISEIDYDAHRSKLLVRFVSGERYVYVGVPGEVHRSFVDAESKGRFFQAEIRDKYPYNRLAS